MKKLFTICIIIALTLAAALVTPWLMEDPGYVYFRFAGYEVEMRFIVALALIFSLILLIWLTIFLIKLPKKTLRNLSTNRSRKCFAKGLLALSEGHWKQAEKLLISSTKNSPTPELGFMAAARAAIAQNKIAEAFNYLDDAENNTDNPLTVDLTRSELWVKIGENTKAIALLNRILHSYPNNPRALHIMVQASQNDNQWHQLREVLPKVQKLDIMGYEQVNQLSHHSISQQLQHANNESELQSTWNSLDKNQKLNIDYIHAYSLTGLKLGMTEQVATLIENNMAKNFSDELLNIWRQLSLDGQDKIKTAEKWLKKNANNALLLQILGQLSLQNKLWAKAKDYLDKSLDLQLQSQTYKLLAQYFDAVGEPDNALQAYQQAEMYYSQLVIYDKD